MLQLVCLFSLQISGTTADNSSSISSNSPLIRRKHRLVRPERASSLRSQTSTRLNKATLKPQHESKAENKATSDLQHASNILIKQHSNSTFLNSLDKATSNPQHASNILMIQLQTSTRLKNCGKKQSNKNKPHTHEPNITRFL